MNISHAEMVTRLMKPKADLQFTPEQADMIHAILGISGECGELLDAVKKHVIYGKPLDMANIIEELGDAEFYLQHLRTILGITREQCIDANMIKLAVRYPGYNYTDSKAKERADKPDGWIEWNGGECPVEKGALVEVKYSNGTYEGRAMPESAYRWVNRDDSQYNIIAYRLA